MVRLTFRWFAFELPVPSLRRSQLSLDQFQQHGTEYHPLRAQLKLSVRRTRQTFSRRYVESHCCQVSIHILYVETTEKSYTISSLTSFFEQSFEQPLIYYLLPCDGQQ
ncbi:hypothetical protein ACTXT7_006899 [Hymenolepis weldensis]